MVIRYARIIANGRAWEGNKGERVGGNGKSPGNQSPLGDVPATTNCASYTVGSRNTEPMLSRLSSNAN